jgi:hypothetical protein
MLYLYPSDRTSQNYAVPESSYKGMIKEVVISTVVNKLEKVIRLKLPIENHEYMQRYLKKRQINGMISQ